MKFSTLITSAAMALVMSAGVAMAQTTPMTKPTVTTTTTDKPMTKMTKVKKPKVAKVAKAQGTRTAVSLQCSADATAKGLTGKPRKAFRKSCMSDKAKATKN